MANRHSIANICLIINNINRNNYKAFNYKHTIGTLTFYIDAYTRNNCVLIFFFIPTKQSYGSNVKICVNKIRRRKRKKKPMGKFWNAINQFAVGANTKTLKYFFQCYSGYHLLHHIIQIWQSLHSAVILIVRWAFVRRF